MLEKNRTFFKKNRLTTIIIVLPVVFFLVTGCSTIARLEKTTKKIVRDIKAPDSGLNKLIGITPFDNLTALTAGNITAIFDKKLSEKIETSCSHILLVKPGDPNYPDFLSRPPKDITGKIDNFNLARAARFFGFNAIVTGQLLDIRGDKKKKGIFWFKKVHSYVQVLITAEVYDTESGAKLMDETFMNEIEIEQADINSVNTVDGIKKLLIGKAFKELVADMSEKICDAVSFQPWRGFITNVEKDRIIISSGQKVGLKTGDIFEVYDSSKTLQGAEGRRFFMPGLKIGEIKITSVDSDRAEAVRISGDDIKPGDCVRPE